MQEETKCPNLWRKGIGDIVGYLDKRNAQGIIIAVANFYELLTLLGIQRV